MIRIPDDQRSVTASEYSEINTDRYPLSANQEHLLKALSRDCEGVAIKYAPCDFLNEYQSFVVLIRMTHGTKLYDFLEVPIDCKFIFLLCGSCKGNQKDLQTCRAFGSLMTDKVRFEMRECSMKNSDKFIWFQPVTSKIKVIMVYPRKVMIVILT